MLASGTGQGPGRGWGWGGHSGMSITRSSSPSRASSPLPASLNICRGTALRIVGGGILGGGSGARVAPTPVPEPRPGKVSGPPTGQSGGPTAICSRGKKHRVGLSGRQWNPGGWQCLLRQFWGMGKGAKAHSRGSGHSRAGQCWNQGPAPPQPLEPRTSKCLEVRGGDGGGDEGGGGEGSYRNQEGEAWPCPLQGGTLAAPVSALTAGQSQPPVPACPPASGHPRPHFASTGLLSSLLLRDSLVRWRVSEVSAPPSPPPAAGGFYLLYLGWAPPWDTRSRWPRPGPPLTAHLGYGPSLLTGLPAFSLSQSQLFLHTAARVSSLKHKPEHVTPPHKGKAPRCPWDRW